MIRCLLLPCFLLSGCIPSATNAVVARYYNNKFQVCTVNLNWTVEQMTSACGEPDLIVTTANSDAECFIYRTDAVVFLNGQGAPVIAACAESRADVMRSTKGKDYRRILSVTGLRAVPGKPAPALPPAAATVESP